MATNNGVYFSTNQGLRLSTSGLTRLTINTAGTSTFSSVTSGLTVVSVRGRSGELISIVDTNRNDILQVNNSSGLPIFEVNANNSVVGGTPYTNTLVVSGTNVGVGTNLPTNKIHISAATDPVRIIGLTANTGDTNVISIGSNGLLHTYPITSIVTTGNSIGSIVYVIDGGGQTITTGVAGDLFIPFGFTINEYTLLADQTGSIVVDIWEDTYGNFPPTVADTITGSAKPTITSSNKAQSSTLTGWQTTFPPNMCFRFNVDSVTTLTRVTLTLKITKT